MLEYIFDNLGTVDKFYVEFGVESCSECNTRLLWAAYGWNGLLMDGSGKTDDNRIIYNHYITPDNIVSLLELHKVPRSFDLLSVDLDFNDYYVARNILRAGFRPRVVVQEINRNWGVDESYTVEVRASCPNHSLFTTLFAQKGRFTHSHSITSRTGRDSSHSSVRVTGVCRNWQHTGYTPLLGMCQSMWIERPSTCFSFWTKRS